MTKDNTEMARRRLVMHQEITGPQTREALEQCYGQVWDTGQLTADFEVIGFMAPFVIVRRRSDRVKGALEFQHNPRFYYDFTTTENK